MNREVVIDELELLARLIECEAGGEGYNGMHAVASVVMNRVNSFAGEYGRYNTVRDVVNAEGQFECISSMIRNVWIVSPDAVAYEIASRAIGGDGLGAVADSLWFFNPFSAVCPGMFPNESGAFYTRIGDHCFYRPTKAYQNT